jgi:cephalosporin hydroxylase
MNKLKPFVKAKFKRIPAQSPVVNPESNMLEVNKWTISDFVSKKLSPLTKNRPFPLDEQMLMTSAVCIVQPDIIFDWGTHIGKSARVFYEICKHFGIKCEIHSIDLPDNVEHEEHPGETRGYLVRGLANVTLHQGDGVKTALKIYKKNGSQRALFYIDGDHSYESVKRELSLILASIERPAVLLHDTFLQSKDSGYNIGPNKAVTEVLRTLKVQPKRIDTVLGLPGMTLLYFA